MKQFLRFGLLIAFLVISVLGFTQSKIDFETVGQNWTWGAFANGAGGVDNQAGLTCPIANPATTGINTSANCLKFVEAPTAAEWGGLFTSNVGTVTITEATKIVKVMVYKSRISSFKLKLEGLDFGGGTEFPGANTVINQWEELSFDLTAQVGKKFNKLVFLPDFTPRTSEVTVYIDNVVMPTVTPPVVATAPTTLPAAPAPPVANVISIYGTNNYTPIAGVDVFPDWGQTANGSTMTSYTIAGTTHNVLKYGKLSFQGIDFTGNVQNVSSMKYLHLDVWSGDAAATPLWVATINVNTNIALSKTITTAGSWYSLDIPLTEFVTGGQNLTAINQLMFTSDEWRINAKNLLAKDIYLDNIYFWTDVNVTVAVSTHALTIASPAGSTGTFNITSAIGWTVASNQTWLTPSIASGTGNAIINLSATVNTALATRTANVIVTGNDATTQTIVVTQNGASVPNAPTPTVAAAKVTAIFSDAYTPVASEYQNWSATSMTEESSVTPANKVKNVSSTCCFGYGLTSNDISSMTRLHVDIYPTTLASMTIGIVSNGDKKVTKTLTPNTWNSIDIALADFIGANLSNVTQIGFWDLNGAFYMDNLYFYNGSPTAVSKLDKSDITVYPNPVKSSLFVNGLPQNATVKIFDMRGALLISKLNVNEKIDVNNLAKGVYIIQISGKNSVTTNKFIKE